MEGMWSLAVAEASSRPGAKKGSLSTAVWNTWVSTASKIADMGADGWRDMVCVEGANTFENALTISAGASHTHVARYSVGSINKIFRKLLILIVLSTQ